MRIRKKVRGRPVETSAEPEWRHISTDKIKKWANDEDEDEEE
jgi:hypothetical protein